MSLWELYLPTTPAAVTKMYYIRVSIDYVAQESIHCLVRLILLLIPPPSFLLLSLHITMFCFVFPLIYPHFSLLLLLVLSLCLTGYGNIAPSTEGGKIFCILYAIFGIPLFGFLLAGIGDQLGTIFVKSILRVERIFRVSCQVSQTFHLFFHVLCWFYLMTHI